MTDAPKEQSYDTTINDFDRVSTDLKDVFPRYAGVIRTIDEIVNTVYSTDTSTDRAARIGMNLLEMVEAANRRRR